MPSVTKKCSIEQSRIGGHPTMTYLCNNIPEHCNVTSIFVEQGVPRQKLRISGNNNKLVYRLLEVLAPSFFTFTHPSSLLGCTLAIIYVKYNVLETSIQG